MESPLSRFEWERLIRELDFPASVKCTAYALATYVNGKTGARGYPGRDKLSRATGLSKHTLTAALAALEAGGLVVRKGHGGGRGVTMAALYDLAVAATGLTDPAETERIVRQVFKARTERKTSDSPTSNGVKRSDFALKKSDSRTKEVGLSDPTMHVTSPISASNSYDPGIVAEVEGNGAGSEAHRQTELDRMTTWMMENCTSTRVGDDGKCPDCGDTLYPIDLDGEMEQLLEECGITLHRTP